MSSRRACEPFPRMIHRGVLNDPYVLYTIYQGINSLFYWVLMENLH